MDRDEFRCRRAVLRALSRSFQGGRLEVGGSGGTTGMMFLRTQDGKQWFMVGITDEAIAHAVLAAVNFALDCCEGISEETLLPAGNCAATTAPSVRDRRGQRAEVPTENSRR